MILSKQQLDVFQGIHSCQEKLPEGGGGPHMLCRGVDKGKSRGFGVCAVVSLPLAVSKWFCVSAEHYDSLTGSLRLITIKPMAAPLNYSYPDSSNHSQDSVILNGEVLAELTISAGSVCLQVNMGLKQKSDIEHYRNKLRLKAKRKGYSDGPVSGGSGSTGGHRHSHRERLRRENASLDLEDALGPVEDRNPSTYVKYRRSESQREPAYWSRQSLNTPSPVETELDLLVMRERSRRGIRNSGYDVSLNITATFLRRPSTL
ncbi:hypothetical protein NFI96_002694 [Prochilodus magdalenae]|nr:hypothetical protein NFI96_002694 [Prochilodus magdalenae]